MAGDWIKVGHVMPDKPEVGLMADALHIDHDAVVGKLVRFWIWADQQSVSGNGLSVTDSFLDRLTNCPGFAVALLDVGWLIRRNGRASLPNFDRHNGQTSKQRALTKDRVKRSRNDDSVTESLPEKRREEKRVKSSKEDLTPCKSPKGDVHFLAWWQKYPKKVGKEKAKAAWIRAGKRIRQVRQCSGIEAVAHMQEAVEAFSVTPKALGPFCPNPATWLNGGNYDDDRAIWELPQEHAGAPERYTVDLANLDLDSP